MTPKHFGGDFLAYSRPALWLRPCTAQFRPRAKAGFTPAPWKTKELTGDGQEAEPKPGGLVRLDFTMNLHKHNQRLPSPAGALPAQGMPPLQCSQSHGACLAQGQVSQSWIPPLKTSSPYFLFYFLPYWLEANKQKEMEGGGKKSDYWNTQNTEIYLPFKSLTRFDYLNKSIWIRFKFQGTQFHSAYHESHLPLHMAVLITQVLLCAPLLTRAPCAPHQAGKGGNKQINSLFIPQWGPRDILVCRRPRRCSQSATGVRSGHHILREKKQTYQILKRRGGLGKLCFLRGRTSAAFNSNSARRKHKHSNASPDAATQERVLFLPLKQPLCPLPEKGAAF